MSGPGWLDAESGSGRLGTSVDPSLELPELDVTDVDADPIRQWHRWFREAVEAGQPEPEATSLATASLDGVPTVRWVLVKQVDGRGFVFYTNAHSRKGRDLAGNPRAALALRWSQLDRQVRVTGPVVATSTEESDAYFASRARGSQIGAWASEQSSVLADRHHLVERVAAVEARFEGEEVVRPPWWGGWRLVPETIEFWQGRASRLHDRIRYRLDDGQWVIERLSP